MPTAAERDARNLKELNLALDALRGLADKEGFIKGSPVELIYNTLGQKGVTLSVSRIRDLVTRLGELGWREEAWIGPQNVRGSKIVMKPRKITNLNVLPEKVKREMFEEEVRRWVQRTRPDEVGQWAIANPRNKEENTRFVISRRELVRPRGKKSHWAFRLNATPSVSWLRDLLGPDGMLTDYTLYQLWKDGHARPA